VFDEIGLFNEDLIRTQDREFNERLRAAGGKILLVPSVRAFYKPRTELGSYLRWVYDGAYWLFLAGKYSDVSMIRTRNVIPLAFVAYLGGLLVLSPAEAIQAIALFSWLLLPILLYFFFLIAAGAIAAVQRSRATLIFTFPIVVALTHVAYGLGSVFGLLKRFT
jgi:GT2 family glycosyltransferase